VELSESNQANVNTSVSGCAYKELLMILIDVIILENEPFSIIVSDKC